MTAASTYDSWVMQSATSAYLGATPSSSSSSSQPTSAFSPDIWGDGFTGHMETTPPTTTTAATTVEASYEMSNATAGPESSTVPLTGDNAEIAQSTVNYEALFRAASEIPPFRAAYRWWEDEARTILWSFDIRQIMLVIRFGLFDDSNLPRSALQRRDSGFIEKFLEGLLQPFELPYLPGLSHAQRVEEILRRCQIAEPVNVPWSWFPARARRIPDPAVIAQEIEAQSHLQFKTVPFETWVRYSLGYPAPEVDWFFLQHSVFYIVLSTYLQTCPDEVPKYQAVEKLMKRKSPFAHRALFQCLSQFQDQSASSAPQSNTAGFEFIGAPIQALFKASRAGLINTVKSLSVLSARYQQNYVHVATMDWYKSLDTKLPFLDSFFASHSATDLARSLNRSDESKFSQLTRENFTSQDNPTVEALHDRWSTLVTAVYECCTALPELVSYIQHCAEILHSLHNYNSTLALIRGLQLFSMSCPWTTVAPDGGECISVMSLTPASLVYLSDASDNYAAYRQAMKSTPGIPFLFPHLVEYRRHGDIALDELFITPPRTQ